MTVDQDDEMSLRTNMLSDTLMVLGVIVLFLWADSARIAAGVP